MLPFLYSSRDLFISGPTIKIGEQGGANFANYKVGDISKVGFKAITNHHDDNVVELKVFEKLGNSIFCWIYVLILKFTIFY